MLSINYLVYSQKQDNKSFGRIICYTNTFEEACINVDAYLYNKNPLSFIQYKGNITHLVPLYVPFLLKHKRDLDNEYGYYIMNNDGINEWCFVQDIRPLDYFIFNKLEIYNEPSDIYCLNTLYPILDYEMPDYYKYTQTDTINISNIRPKYIVYIHFSNYTAGVIIGMSNNYDIAKNIAFKYMKDKLSPYANRMFLTTSIYDVPYFFLNHDIISYYLVTLDNNSVYCVIQKG
jgi:hypothetical protein